MLERNYAQCPECGSVNIETEKRLNGNSECRDCSHLAFTTSFLGSNVTSLSVDTNIEDVVCEHSNDPSIYEQFQKMEEKSREEPNKLRPDHYKQGEDTFAWAERKFDTSTCLAIAAFNIHKYNDRDKDQDFEDFGKISDYSMWARRLMELK